MNPQVFLDTKGTRNYVVLVFGDSAQDDGSEVAIALSPKEFTVLTAAGLLPRP
ncbi:hypothetical protein [Bacillus thuringiensis]|uniref:Uncharacterized protein n=1 Tax=Bacillus thuringiensis Bt18247 TaxID=1423143 RepID=A0A9W3T0B4_BACTU|nr:hypothetical protein [Bacillus thuringiensis]AOM14723.1 hypothetical protein BTI247_63940 [Bacillus thuringiensis Bt18247]